ncbi:MAG TPA: TetR/AcrR family transcriptional regulator [Marmoricola sp.]|nr:TetR/AcrR family transcriptional regulator [Marmoricola sp.]
MSPQSPPGPSLDSLPEASQRLVRAAVDAFATRGFHGTTTRDIAATAGMSPAALYVHHRSKEDLLYLISRTGHQRTLDLVREAVASADGPVERLVALVRAFTRHHAEGHTTARIVNYELAALSAEHYAVIAEIRRSIEQEMRSVVEAGVASGDFHTTDAHMTALALLSLGIDVARWYRDDGSWRPDDVAEHYAGLALRMVGVR